MSTELSETQRDVLRALCDTFVPAIEEADDPLGFWGRAASHLGVDQAITEFLMTSVPEQIRAGLLQLLDGLEAHGFAGAPQEAREQILGAVAGSSPEAADAVHAYAQLTLMLTYAMPDANGQNPNWAVFGYPGPRAAPPDVPKPIRPVVPTGDQLELEADVCIVGSGAGGGVIAGTLAAQGHRVVVLEAGGYYNEADFNQLELWAYQHLYWRGGFTPTFDRNVNMIAGATLGGGTTVNWMNCVRTPPAVRAQWAREFGLEGLDGDEFDRHLDAVLARISANDECSDYNGPHLRLKQGAEKLGYSFRRAVRNADPRRYNPETAGYIGFGDQSSSKQGTLWTYLQDAYDHGAQIVVGCHADRVLVEQGRAVGVAATYADASGRRASVTVRAPQVVVACGALETPALLLRSGIGGPAVGQYLRLHPVVALVGVYDSDQQAWWGPTQAGICDQFADTGGGHGFLIECTHYNTGLSAAATPWTSGREHKALMAQLKFGATLLALVRDHGAGSVTIDAAGSATPLYPLDDATDLRNLREGLAAVVRIAEAAGARQIYGLAPGIAPWNRGDDLEDFIRALQDAPIGAGGHATFSAHQMGSARMGSDPATCVANPRGELHDTRGVWIGDTSAFPTSSGVNPMITCMALAHRTAEAIDAAIEGRAISRGAA